MIQLPPHFIMLIACSAKKTIAPGESCRSADMYDGTINKKAQAIAKAHGMPYVILSAKYKFVKPDTVIEWYEQRFTAKNPFKGPWPPEPWHGLFCGGADYFKFAPKRFERIVPILPIGEMQSALKRLEENPEEVQEIIRKHLERYSR